MEFILYLYVNISKGIIWQKKMKYVSLFAMNKNKMTVLFNVHLKLLAMTC